MKKADINRGLQRLVESYTPEISTSDILDFLKKKGFDTSSKITQNYADAVAEYLSYDPEIISLEDWYEGTEINYPEDLEELPRLDEALSDEVKANNEMMDKILSKSPSKLTKAEKEFLDKNGLKRTTVGSDAILQKGNASLLKGQQISRSHKDKDKVDKLDYLNKRDERSRYSEEDPLRANRARRNNFKSQKQQANRFRDAAMKSPDNFDYLNKYADQWDKRADANYAFHSNKFAESLEEDDYFDFVHDLSTSVKQCTKKWQSRGISASDVAKALDELSIRFEDLPDEAVEESLNFKTMPIPKEGATFAFRATVDEPEVSRLLQKKNLKFDKVNENGTIVWLIGHGDTDHIATYVPSTKTLYTDTRELFREAFSLKKR